MKKLFVYGLLILLCGCATTGKNQSRPVDLPSVNYSFNTR